LRYEWVVNIQASGSAGPAADREKGGMVDFSVQRLNMVESQVRPSELTDRRIARGMMAVPREAFLPAALHGVAYSDSELPLDRIEGADGGRRMLAARTVAMMIQALEVADRDVVLLVGGATGYEAALLADMVQTVVCLESDEGLANSCEATLSELGIGNVAVVRDKLASGYASEGPYDAILVNGAVDDVGDELLDQLKDGGRLVAVHRMGQVSRVTIWQRTGEQFARIEKGTAGGPVLPGFARETAFSF
jgi:protein-L-isoaspartate(D-aspartate) O-methyltransferase